MIRIIGDVHADFYRLNEILEDTPLDMPVIQVGDLGFWPDKVKNGVKFSRPFYFIDGNHEYFPTLWRMGRYVQHEAMPNAIYVPRGTVMELDGRSVLFIGGGESPDMLNRIEGVNWFREESIMQKDVNRIPEDVKIDIMVTHVPPYSAIHTLFGGDTPTEWNYSSRLVESVWSYYGKPALYCGHLHHDAEGGNVNVLGILSYVNV